MAEHIEREAAIEKTEAFCDVFVTKWTDEKVIAWIRKLPAADVVPMEYHERCLEIEIQKRLAIEPKRGRWIRRKNWDKYVCSECSREEERPRKHCPECGTRMDGE